jgi:hypothetical protein
LHHGGSSAAPLFAKVAPAQLARHGILLERMEPETMVAARTPEPERARPATERPQPATERPKAPAPAAVAAAPPRRDPAPAASESPVANLSSFRDRILLPDFRGLSRSEVMQVTAANGLRANLHGDGLAVRQDPPPGSVVVAGSETVRIEFSPAAQRPGGRG